MSDLIPCRIERRQKYRSISLIAAEDPRLSWAAKGVHTYLITRPEDWKLYYSDLLARSSNSRTALKSAIRNLKQAGYLVLEPIQGEDGKFKGWRWVVYEEPQNFGEESQSSPKARKPTFGKTVSRKNRPTENIQGNNNHNNNNNHSKYKSSLSASHERLLAEAQKLFPDKPLSIELPTRNLDYFLQLYEEGRAKLATIDTPIAYIKGLIVADDYIPYRERQRRRVAQVREEIAKKRQQRELEQQIERERMEGIPAEAREALDVLLGRV
ncbi:MAG: hypothetical protein AB1553_05610 [Nitrospirota bacterium]